jgi:hypothetical protein
MATTTPNFGWPVPTSTDLVKDGATAIEALGDSIDASLLDLKGGTTGQVLSKNSNTDMDFTWVTDAAGDITGVTAGTGISGGGTSGTVTVTNSMATAIDAKGDLVVGTGADTFSRLAIGTDAQVLTADSTAATGMKWAAGGSTSGPAFRASKTGSNQTLTAGTYAKLQYNSEIFDTDSKYDTSTYTFSPTTAGYYQVSCTARITTTSSNIFIGFSLDNGSIIYQQTIQPPTGTNNAVVNGSTLFYMNGTTNTLTVFATVDGGTGANGQFYADETASFTAIWIRS